MGTIEERVAVLESDIKHIVENTAEIKRMISEELPKLRRRAKKDLVACAEKHAANCPVNPNLATVASGSWLNAATIQRALIGLGLIGSLIGGYYGINATDKPPVAISGGK